MRALQFGLVCMQMNVCGPGCTQRTAMGKHCCQLVKPQGGKRHMCFSMKVPTNCIWELLASCDVQGTKLAGKAQTELGTGSETGRKKSSRSPREGSPGSKQVTATSHCGPSAGLGLLASAAHRRVELTQSCLHNALQVSARGEGAAAARAISLFCRPPRGGLGSPLLPSRPLPLHWLGPDAPREQRPQARPCRVCSGTLVSLMCAMCELPRALLCVWGKGTKQALLAARSSQVVINELVAVPWQQARTHEVIMLLSRLLG